ncbi:MAG: hypothetical protein PVJ53_12750 [Desulfobacterales bacterium]|jgi:hypothetical protein
MNGNHQVFQGRPREALSLSLTTNADRMSHDRRTAILTFGGPLSGGQYRLQFEYRSIKELNSKSLGVQPDNFTAALHFALIISKRTGHNNVLPDQKLRFALDIGSPGTEVQDAPLKQPTVGCEMRIFRASYSDMPTRLFILRPAQAFSIWDRSRPHGWFAR